MVTEPTKRAGPLARYARLAVLAAVVYLAVRTLQAQPSELEVDYDYGPVARELRGATMRYRRDGAELRRVSFQYHRRGATGSSCRTGSTRWRWTCACARAGVSGCGGRCGCAGAGR